MTIDRSPRGSKQKERHTGDKKKTPVERARSIEAMRVRACSRRCTTRVRAPRDSEQYCRIQHKLAAARASCRRTRKGSSSGSAGIEQQNLRQPRVQLSGWLVLSFSQPPASGQLHAFQLWGLFSPRRRRRDVDLKLRLGGYRASRRRLSLSLTKLSSDAGIVGFLPGLHAQPTPPLGLPCTSALLVGAARMRDRVGDLVSGVRANCRHRRRRNTRRRREISDFPF